MITCDDVNMFLLKLAAQQGPGLGPALADVEDGAAHVSTN